MILFLLLGAPPFLDQAFAAPSDGGGSGESSGGSGDSSGDAAADEEAEQKVEDVENAATLAEFAADPVTAEDNKQKLEELLSDKEAFDRLVDRLQNDEAFRASLKLNRDDPLSTALTGKGLEDTLGRLAESAKAIGLSESAKATASAAAGSGTSGGSGSTSAQGTSSAGGTGPVAEPARPSEPGGNREEDTPPPRPSGITRSEATGRINDAENLAKRFQAQQKQEIDEAISDAVRERFFTKEEGEALRKGTPEAARQAIVARGQQRLEALAQRIKQTSREAFRQDEFGNDFTAARLRLQQQELQNQFNDLAADLKDVLNNGRIPQTDLDRLKDTTLPELQKLREELVSQGGFAAEVRQLDDAIARLNAVVQTDGRIEQSADEGIKNAINDLNNDLARIAEEENLFDRENRKNANNNNKGGGGGGSGGGGGDQGQGQGSAGGGSAVGGAPSDSGSNPADAITQNEGLSDLAKELASKEQDNSLLESVLKGGDKDENTVLDALFAKLIGGGGEEEKTSSSAATDIAALASLGGLVAPIDLSALAQNPVGNNGNANGGSNNNAGGNPGLSSRVPVQDGTGRNPSGNSFVQNGLPAPRARVPVSVLQRSGVSLANGVVTNTGAGRGRLNAPGGSSYFAALPSERGRVGYAMVPLRPTSSEALANEIAVKKLLAQNDIVRGSTRKTTKRGEEKRSVVAQATPVRAPASVERAPAPEEQKPETDTGFFSTLIDVIRRHAK